MTQKTENLEQMVITLVKAMEQDRTQREQDRTQREQDRTQREQDRAESKAWREESQKEMKILQENQKDLQKGMKKLEKIWADAGLMTGEIVEESIMYAIPKVFKQKGKLFKAEDIRKRVKVKDPNNNQVIAEYDVIAPNGTEVLVVEAKNRLIQQDVKKFLEKQIPPFKKYFPEYTDYKVLGAVGGMIVDKSVQKYAQDHGLYVFIQNGDNMCIMNNENFVPA